MHTLTHVHPPPPPPRCRAVGWLATCKSNGRVGRGEEAEAPKKWHRTGSFQVALSPYPTHCFESLLEWSIQNRVKPIIALLLIWCCAAPLRRARSLPVRVRCWAQFDREMQDEAGPSFVGRDVQSACSTQCNLLVARTSTPENTKPLISEINIRKYDHMAAAAAARAPLEPVPSALRACRTNPPPTPVRVGRRQTCHRSQPLAHGIVRICMERAVQMRHEGAQWRLRRAPRDWRSMAALRQRRPLPAPCKRRDGPPLRPPRQRRDGLQLIRRERRRPKLRGWRS
jgi:hypothetical protein